eukprot:SAG22_NODE_122_length_18920_cov_23.494076_12_plen_182_part_00
MNASTGVYGRGQACQPAEPESPANCQWWQVAPAWMLELLDNTVAADIGYADSTTNMLGVVGNMDYGDYPLPGNLTGPMDRGYVPFGSLTQQIVVRGNSIQSEGQLSVQADRDDGVSAINCVVEHNAVTGPAAAGPAAADADADADADAAAADGEPQQPPLLLSANNSGFVVRENSCDGRPC